MRGIVFCATFSFLIGFVFCTDRPLGVPPQLAPLYEEKNEFECVDGSKKIPFDQVNDEYCDCQDGSDEPGTSACSNGHFYCSNAGFRPVTIPSSRVNDFICDCCDGSDEWNSGVQCANICKTQGEKAREEAKQQRHVQEIGYAKRIELAKSGASFIDEKRADVDKSRQELDELQRIKNDLEEKKNAAEQRERDVKDKHETAYNALKEEHQIKKDNELFGQITGGKTMTLEHLAEYVKSKGEVAHEKLKEIFGERNEMDIEAFRLVSKSIRQMLKTVMQVGQNITGTVTDQPGTESLTTSTTSQAEEEGDDTSEEEYNKNSEETTTAEVGHSDEGDDDDDQVPRPPYDEVAQTLIDEANSARQAFEETLNKVTELENNIRNSESLLAFEYGPGHVWASLKGQCTELQTSQYTYRLCPFDRAIQKDRNGHSEVNLGYWGHWSGPESNKFSAQVYDKGQGCWNGPERSTSVEILCGAELELVEASEPSKCTYRFVLKSPAACENPAEMSAGHDEF